MGAFGRIPKGHGFGYVPKWVMRDPTVEHGPKALFALLCTHANPEGNLYKSLANIALDLGVSERQAQRWLSKLEASGLVKRVGFRGSVQRFMLIRDESGRAATRRENTQHIQSRRQKFAKFPNTATQSVHQQCGEVTPVSPPADTTVADGVKQMAPKQNPNKTPKTERPKSQRLEAPPTKTQLAFRPKSLNCERGSRLQGFLNEVAEDCGGWESFLSLDTKSQFDALKAAAQCEFTDHEIGAALGQRIPELPSQDGLTALLAR